MSSDSTTQNNDVAARKNYVFNKTGNIMIASTCDVSQPVEESVQKVFAEASVFYAGMTRAISTTINPKTKETYSIYDYDAIKEVVDGSGLFVQVTQEDVTIESKSFGISFSKELIEGLLGLAAGAGGLEFAHAMVSSLGNKGFNISRDKNSKTSKLGNIIFVCEYLLGIPCITAIVAYIDIEEHEQQFNVGPCIKEHSKSLEWKIHKDTYLFVTPAFINEYSGDIDEVQTDAAYIDMVNWFQSLILKTPKIIGVYDDAAADPSPVTIDANSVGQLQAGQTYQLLGQYLPTDDVTITFNATGSSAPKLTVQKGTMTGTSIRFSIAKSATMSEATAIKITSGSGSTAALITSGSFVVVPPNS